MRSSFAAAAAAACLLPLETCAFSFKMSMKGEVCANSASGYFGIPGLAWVLSVFATFNVGTGSLNYVCTQRQSVCSMPVKKAIPHRCCLSCPTLSRKTQQTSTCVAPHSHRLQLPSAPFWTSSPSRAFAITAEAVLQQRQGSAGVRLYFPTCHLASFLWLARAEAIDADLFWCALRPDSPRGTNTALLRPLLLLMTNGHCPVGTRALSVHRTMPSSSRTRPRSAWRHFVAEALVINDTPCLCLA